jgi:hypothetical protein
VGQSLRTRGAIAAASGISLIGLLAGCTPAATMLSADRTPTPTVAPVVTATPIPTVTPAAVSTTVPAHPSAPVHKATPPKVVAPIAPKPKPAPNPPAALLYADGPYDESGSYVSPGGPETIQVHLTLAHDVVTAVSVTPGAANDPTATSYENLFAGGLNKVVVGKNIDSLHVGAVGGSSLTAQGFNAALAKIKNDAKL